MHVRYLSNFLTGFKNLTSLSPASHKNLCLYTKETIVNVDSSNPFAWKINNPLAFIYIKAEQFHVCCNQYICEFNTNNHILGKIKKENILQEPYGYQKTNICYFHYKIKTSWEKTVTQDNNRKWRTSWNCILSHWWSLQNKSCDAFKHVQTLTNLIYKTFICKKKKYFFCKCFFSNRQKLVVLMLYENINIPRSGYNQRHLRRRD